jgi:hypothetical protein
MVAKHDDRLWGDFALLALAGKSFSLDARW